MTLTSTRALPASPAVQRQPASQRMRADVPASIRLGPSVMAMTSPTTTPPPSATLGAHMPISRAGRLAAGTRQWRTAAQWIENSATVDVDVPVEEAWVLWDDRERIPNWMEWINSVTVVEDVPKQSRWTLMTRQFGRDWTLSWLAENLAPIPLQKIHWKSVPGSMSVGIEVTNRGSIRFFRRTPTSCNVTLTISYEVPDALAPFGNALQPLVESILDKDMKLFAKYALKVSPSKAAK